MTLFVGWVDHRACPGGKPIVFHNDDGFRVPLNPSYSAAVPIDVVSTIDVVLPIDVVSTVDVVSAIDVLFSIDVLAARAAALARCLASSRCLRLSCCFCLRCCCFCNARARVSRICSSVL